MRGRAGAPGGGGVLGPISGLWCESGDPPPRLALCAALTLASRLKSETCCICFSKTFQSLIVLSFVDTRNQAPYAPWRHHRSVLNFSTISSD